MANVLRSVEFEVPLSGCMEALWHGMVLLPAQASGRCPFPEVVPEVYASVEGPWLDSGSVLRVKFNNGLKDCKWTFTALDSAALSSTWTWVEEEGPMAMRRSHVISVVYKATGTDSFSIHFSLQFDGEVSAEYVQSLKETVIQTALLFNSRLTTCIAQPN